MSICILAIEGALLRSYIQRFLMNRAVLFTDVRRQ